MTPTEIIEEVLLDTSRPDLQQNLLNVFPAMLRKVHSIDTFVFDKETYSIADPAIVSGSYKASTNTIFPRLRRIVDVATYDSYTGVGSEIDPYVGVSQQSVTWLQATSAKPKMDYFGFIQEQTYYMSGGIIALKGVSDSTRLIELETISWPSWEYDDFADEYTTSSWICEKFPELVKANLKLVVARIAQADDAVKEANTLIATTQYDFLRTFAAEIYHAS